MFKSISLLILLAAIYYVTPPLNVLDKRDAESKCHESSPIRSKCKEGNAFVFYGSPSDTTEPLIKILKQFRISATFVIAATESTDWHAVSEIIRHGHTSLHLT